MKNAPKPAREGPASRRFRAGVKAPGTDQQLLPREVPRKQRADAQRNRERILEAARQAFTRHGAEASLDEIARQAAVGPGTLYRHFPTRDALIEGVYHREIEKLRAAGERFLATRPPLDALRRWMLLFIDYVANKYLIMPALNSVLGGSTRLIEGSRDPIHDIFLRLIGRAMENGDLRSDIDPHDITRVLIGTFYTMAMPGWKASARRIVDLLLEGVRPR